MEAFFQPTSATEAVGWGLFHALQLEASSITGVEPWRRSGCRASTAKMGCFKTVPEASPWCHMRHDSSGQAASKLATDDVKQQKQLGEQGIRGSRKAGEKPARNWELFAALSLEVGGWSCPSPWEAQTALEDFLAQQGRQSEKHQLPSSPAETHPRAAAVHGSSPDPRQPMPHSQQCYYPQRYARNEDKRLDVLGYDVDTSLAAGAGLEQPSPVVSHEQYCGPMRVVGEVQPPPIDRPSWNMPGEWDDVADTVRPNLYGSREWEYLDMAGKVQGPFSSCAMHSWFSYGFLPMSLLVRPSGDSGFLPVNAYFPDGLPFSTPVSSPTGASSGAIMTMASAFDTQLLSVDAYGMGA